MGKNELSEAGTSMVRDNMANFRRDTRKTRVTGYPGGKACGALTQLASNNEGLVYKFKRQCTFLSKSVDLIMSTALQGFTNSLVSPVSDSK